MRWTFVVLSLGFFSLVGFYFYLKFTHQTFRMQFNAQIKKKEEVK